MNIIELRNINKVYGSGDNQVRVLKDVNLDIESGDFVAIIGQSGSGKSTLMNILGCLDTASSGDYRIAGENVAGMTPDQLATLRSQYLGFIFQRYNLLSTLDAEENVELPAIYSGMKHQERQKRAEELLTHLDLGNRIEHLPSELSGGQQQRVAIARALAMKPDILCFDEPTSALDPELTGEVLKVIRSLADQHTTMVIVTHEMAFARDVADYVIFMDGGVIVEQGDAHQVIEHPREERTRQFLARYSEG